MADLPRVVGPVTSQEGSCSNCIFQILQNLSGGSAVICVYHLEYMEAVQ